MLIELEIIIESRAGAKAMHGHRYTLQKILSCATAHFEASDSHIELSRRDCDVYSIEFCVHFGFDVKPGHVKCSGYDFVIFTGKFLNGNFADEILLGDCVE